MKYRHVDPRLHRLGRTIGPVREGRAIPTDRGSLDFIPHEIARDARGEGTAKTAALQQKPREGHGTHELELRESHRGAEQCGTGGHQGEDSEVHDWKKVR